MAEGTRLLSEYGDQNSIAGSNPALSVQLLQLPAASGRAPAGEICRRGPEREVLATRPCRRSHIARCRSRCPGKRHKWRSLRRFCANSVYFGPSSEIPIEGGCSSKQGGG